MARSTLSENTVLVLPMKLDKFTKLLENSTEWVIRRQEGVRFVVQSTTSTSSLKVIFAGVVWLVETWAPTAFEFELSEESIRGVLPLVLKQKNSDQGRYVVETFPASCARHVAVGVYSTLGISLSPIETRKQLSSLCEPIASQPTLHDFEWGLCLKVKNWCFVSIARQGDVEGSSGTMCYCTASGLSEAMEFFSLFGL